MLQAPAARPGLGVVRARASPARAATSKLPMVKALSRRRSYAWLAVARNCALWLAMVGLGSGCNSAAPLASTHTSAAAVATAVVDALARQDRAALDALALNEQEFKDHVWPELPAARPERNLPFSYVWLDLHQKSNGALAQTLGRQGGRRYELIGVTFEGKTDYPSYTVHRSSTLRVRGPDGVTTDVRLFGSMIEKDGAWKVVSYVVDD